MMITTKKQSTFQFFSIYVLTLKSVFQFMISHCFYKCTRFLLQPNSQFSKMPMWFLPINSHPLQSLRVISEKPRTTRNKRTTYLIQILKSVLPNFQCLPNAEKAGNVLVFFSTFNYVFVSINSVINFES